MLKPPRLPFALLLLAMTVATTPANPFPPQDKKQSEGDPAGQLGEDQVLDEARTVGKPRSREEFRAWEEIRGTTDVRKQARLAERFLKKFPDSGLTAWAHLAIANAAFSRNDTDRFIRHGEEALLELPDTPEILAPLANIYSETKRIERATDYATRALGLLDRMEKPEGQDTLDWVAMKQGWAADAHYALGRSILEVWTKSPNKPVGDLEEAVEHLKQTLKMNPGHGYAAFRLGFAASRTHDYDTALLAYARAAVIEGPAANSAKGHVQRLHDGLKNVPNSRWASTNANKIIRDERKRLESEMDAKEQEYSRLAAEYDAAVPENAAPPTLVE